MAMTYKMLHLEVLVIFYRSLDKFILIVCFVLSDIHRKYRLRVYFTRWGKSGIFESNTG